MKQIKNKHFEGLSSKVSVLVGDFLISRGTCDEIAEYVT